MINSATTLRLSGIASGMDTESVIKQLMEAKKSRLYKYNQKEEKIGWQMESYQEVNKKLANFILDSRKKLGFNKVSYTGKLYAGSIDEVNWAKKASVNSSAFTARAKADAPLGEMRVKVNKLASSASITGKAITKDEIESAGNGDFIRDGKFTKDHVLNISTNEMERNSSGKLVPVKKEHKIEIKAGETLEAAIGKIKGESNLDISFGKVGQTNENKDQFMLFMSSKKQGRDEKISFDDKETIEFFSNLGLKEKFKEAEQLNNNDRLEKNVELSKDSTGELSAISFGGSNSVVLINGNEVTNKTNEIYVNGVSLSLKSESAKDSIGDMVTVGADTDAVFDKIKEFVEGYNKVIGELQDKVKEKEYKDFTPLLKEQKENMKEEDIKLWEAKAKSGLLRNDDTINNMLSSIRSGLYEQVNGTGEYDKKTQQERGYMFDYGITTGNWKDGAKLVINEDKLRKAIAEDPNKVLNVLFKTPEDTGDHKIGSKEYKEQRANTGVFVRVMDDMANGMKEMVTKAGSGKEDSLLRSVRGNIMVDIVTQGGKSKMEKDLYDIEKLIIGEETRLSNYESGLWRKFTAMEKALQEMQGQSGWLAQQFGGN